MNFTSVWDDAGDDAEQVESSRALALAKSASRTLVWPFLALSASATEVEQRLALSEPSIVAVAASSGVSYDTFLAALRSDALLLVEAKQAASDRPGGDWYTNEYQEGDDCPHCGARSSNIDQTADAGSPWGIDHFKCSNCGGKMGGGDGRQRQGSKQASLLDYHYLRNRQDDEDRAPRAVPGRAPGAVPGWVRRARTGRQCPNCTGAGSIPAQGHEAASDVDNGYVKCPTCDGDGFTSRPGERRSSKQAVGDYGREGYDPAARAREKAQQVRDHKAPWANDPGMEGVPSLSPDDEEDRSFADDPNDYDDDHHTTYSSRMARLKTALEEGADPLTWLEGEDGPPAAPEVVGGHQETGDYSNGYSEVPSAISAVSSTHSGITMPGDGEETHYESEGIPFTVGYHSWQAEGDDGRPAKGYTKGAYTVTDGDGNTKSFEHTPHGPGLTGARPYAGQQAAQHMMSQWSKAKMNRLGTTTSSRGRHPFGERKTAARDPQAHQFDSTGEAYNASQTSDDIHDGDVLHVPSEGVTGVLNQAWPIAIHHNGNPGEFHTLKKGTSLSDVGDYGRSLDLAHKVHSGEAQSTPHSGGGYGYYGSKQGAAFPRYDSGDTVYHPEYGKGEIDRVDYDTGDAHVQYEKDGKNVVHPKGTLRKRPSRDDDWGDSWNVKQAVVATPVLHAIRDRDPDGGSRQPTPADYAAHKNWAVKTHGQEAWDTYSGAWGHQPGDDPRHVESARRTAHGDHQHPDTGPYFDGEESGGLHRHDERGNVKSPGLGCPHCGGGFFSEEARTGHIREHHKGEYSGPSADMVQMKDLMRGSSRRRSPFGV